MKNQNAFLRQISKNGLYIILFLCVLAVGISGYVMYRVQEEEMPLADEVMQVEEEPEYEPEYEPVVIPEATETLKEIQKEEPPVEIPVANLRPQYVTAVSGEVINPFTGDEMVQSKTFGDWRTHAGIDVAAKIGSEVYAISDGVVSDVYADDLMGHTVIIEHEEVVSRYCNLAPEIIVKKGDKVSLGTVIGNVGNSAVGECMEVEHLHLEVTRDGMQVDPMSLVE